MLACGFASHQAQPHRNGALGMRRCSSACRKRVSPMAPLLALTGPSLDSLSLTALSTVVAALPPCRPRCCRRRSCLAAVLAVAWLTPCLPVEPPLLVLDH